MTKEENIREQMIALGTWNIAFGPVVHSLCVLERETARIRKEWKLTAPPGRAPSAMDPHYAVIRSNERESNALRDALGLTPRGLRKLKGTGTSEGTNETPEPDTVLSVIRGRYAG